MPGWRLPIALHSHPEYREDLLGSQQPGLMLGMGANHDDVRRLADFDLPNKRTAGSVGNLAC
jgi:hypothetical protein